MNLTTLKRMVSEGDMSKNALRYLLQCGGECEYLDFKLELHLDQDHGRASFSKDALAMKNVGGGYIVVGVEDKTWKLAGLGNQLSLDTKLLRDVLQKCMGISLEVDIVQYQYPVDDGSTKWFALILIRASAKSNHKRAPTVCRNNFCPKENWGLHAGEIYIRKGDSTVKVTTDNELEQLLEDLEARHERSNIEAVESSPSPFAVEDGLYRLLSPGYEAFIGRDSQKQEVLDAIEQDPRIWIVNLHGPGGVGKTALATWAVYEYYRHRKDVFEAILFLSAKDRELTTQGIGRVYPSLYSLENLLQNILLLFSHGEFCEKPLDTQKSIAIDLLCAYRTLLVLDNMETVTDGRIVNFIQDLPPQILTKVLMTSRTRTPGWERPLQIKELSLEEVQNFVIKRSLEMGLDDRIRQPEPLKIIKDITGGLPLAIQWTLGRYATNGNLQEILDTATAADSPLLEFSFRSSWIRLTESAQHAMAVLTIFDEPPTRQLWRTILDWPLETVDEAIDLLQSMTFIYQTTDNKAGEVTYQALPITLTFSRNMLGKMGSLERLCRQRYQEYKEQLRLVSARLEQYDELFSAFEVKSDNERRAIVICQMAERQETFGVEEAEHYYKEALDTEPRSIYVNVKYGRFLVSLGRIGEGLKLLKIATERSSKSTAFFAYYNLGIIYDQLHNREDCARALREALKHKPEHIAARHMLGVTLSRLGQFDEAVQIFNTLIDEEVERPSGPTNTLAYAARTKIISLIKAKRFDQAKQALMTYRALIASFPSIAHLVGEIDEIAMDYEHQLQ